MDRGVEAHRGALPTGVAAKGDRRDGQRRTAEHLRWSPKEKKRYVSLATHGGSLRNRERAQGVTTVGESWNPHGSRRRGGEDVDRRPKGVGALLFGCSERAGRWRGGLLSGARSRRPWRKGFRRLERKQREMRMGCVGAGSAREKGGKGAWYGTARRREGGPVGVEQRQPVDNDPGTPITSGLAWPLKTEEVGGCHVGPTAQCRSAGSNGVQSI
jgi:hypothetical protein